MLKQFSILLIIIAVTACSSPIERRQVNDDDSYSKVSNSEKLLIPDGLLEPRYSNEYKIPAIGDTAAKGSVGKNLDIRPPLQVLPLANGLHVEDNEDSTMVIVDSINNDINLKRELFDTVKGYLTDKSIKIITQDYDDGIIETDWITTQDVIDTHFFTSDETYQVRQRYRFTISVSPQGRSGSLAIELVDHQQDYKGKVQQILLNGEDKRRYTVDMLNSAIAYLDSKRSKTLKAE